MAVHRDRQLHVRPSPASADHLLHHYISHAKGALDTNFIQGDYNTLDLRLSAQARDTTLTLFVTNITNSHGVTSGGSYGTTAFGQQYYLVRPRTIGATLDWHP